MSQVPPRLITYCSNVHAGESWSAVWAALQQHIPPIKAALSPDRPFPIGLRLSCQAADELTPADMAQFANWLAAQGCYVPSLNGFPYGEFHGARVKEQVYLPDWRSPERARYSMRLADILATWLPAGHMGSISSVPLGFKHALPECERPAVRQQLLDTLRHLHTLHHTLGKEIVLALEPEPGCLLETTDEVCQFFAWLDLPDALRPYLGVCYDCCHQAVQFENPAASLAQLQAAGIRIAKVQVSSALHLDAPTPAQLQRFDEARYLHQVVIQSAEGTLLRFDDLPEALASHPAQAGERWRCHFHLPIFLGALDDGMATTQPFIKALLTVLPAELLLEVETYTWDVLPAALRGEPLTQAIIRELQWLKEHCDAT